MIGLTRDLLNGDFSGAWEHFKDLMINNKVEYAKEKLGILKDKFEELKEKIGEWVTFWREKVDEFVNSWKEKISAWWTDNVAPWFTVEKWESIIQGMVDGFANCWNKVYDFFTKSVPGWWDNTIAPWFTQKQWLSLWDGVKQGVSDGWNSVVSFFTESIPNWWHNQVEPWFSVDTWLGLLKNVKKAFSDVFTKIVEIVKTPINAIIDALDNLIDGINKMNIKVPEIKGITKGFSLGFSLPRIEPLAAGAVIPPNREFLAMLGDQKSGRNIETPEALLRQIFQEESGSSEILTMLQQLIQVVEGKNFSPIIQADGRTMAQVVNKANKALGYAVANP